MKTYKQWLDTETINFMDFVEPGDEVDHEMVDYFMNSVTPRHMSDGLLVVGTPIRDILDNDGKWRPTYITFMKENDSWIYKGLCFIRTVGNKEQLIYPRPVERSEGNGV